MWKPRRLVTGITLTLLLVQRLRYGLDNARVGVRFSAGETFLLLHSYQTSGCSRSARSAATCSRRFLPHGFFTLKMEAIRSSETSVHTRSTRRHIPEDGILHSHRRENLRSDTNATEFLALRVLPNCAEGPAQVGRCECT
jgi:hypothetical protein